MRGKRAPRRVVAPDQKFNSTNIAKLINYVMRRGKKRTATSTVYRMMERVSEKSKQDPLAVYEQAIKNVSPQLEVRSKRVGGANYQIPVEVRGERKYTLACRWILAAAKSRKGKPMHEKLADEVLAAARGEGAAIKKKEDTIRMAEANRAFAHFG